MNQAFLKSDGLLVPDAAAGAGNPLPYFNHGISLDPGYTLRSYFRLLERHPLLQEVNAFAPVLMEQYRRCPKSGCVDAGVDHLEFNKTVEMIGFPGKPRMEIYTQLKGVFQTQSVEIRSLRLDHLLDIPMKLGRLKHIVFGDKMDMFEFDTVYTLFEFIDGVAWALSFHGTTTECQIRR